MPEASFQIEYLPATIDSEQHLVLLHGWSGSRELWRPLLAPLRGLANLVLVDWLPPPDVPSETGLAATVEGLLDRLPARFGLLGWSLGGQLAAALAARAPSRVDCLVTVCSNPCFLARADWPGLSPEDLAAMGASLPRHPVQTLRRFDALQGRGAPRAWLRYLQQCRRELPLPALQAGLAWLGDLDLREVLATLPMPQRHLLGEADALVPPDLAPALESLLAGQREAVVAALPAVGHLLPLQASEALLAAIAPLLESSAAGIPQGPEPVSKQAIANSFSRAAPHYDSVAQVQREVGDALLSRLPETANTVDTVVDLGCGTGYFRPALQHHYPGAAYLGLDIAAGMLAWARQQDGEGQARWVVGDAEALPLATASVDLIFSSLALQWCYHPRRLLAELARVLKPGSCALFSTLGPSTLHELRGAWAAVDDGQHVNRFLPLSALQEAAASLPGVTLHAEVETRVVHHAAVADLLRELKTLGAHNMNSGRAGGLTTRRQLAAMLRAYERFREPRGLPATWEVIHARLELQS
ncbi:malonyl-ACP O-methyltransferase BioC [Haliea atlantica]